MRLRKITRYIYISTYIFLSNYPFSGGKIAKNHIFGDFFDYYDHKTTGLILSLIISV